MIGYKVLISDRRHSVVARGASLVTYVRDEWVEAPKWLAEQGYHLTFFETRTSAERYLEYTGFLPERYEIWKVEASGVLQELPKLCFLTELGMRNFRLWPGNPSWPSGTLMAKKIKLLEVVQYDRI